MMFNSWCIYRFFITTEKHVHYYALLTYYYVVLLGVRLDRTLTYRRHLESLRKKLTSRVANLEAAWWLGLRCGSNEVGNSILSPGPLKQNCAPAWCRSARIGLIDPVINDALWTVTGCLRFTPADIRLILTGTNLLNSNTNEPYCL